MTVEELKSLIDCIPTDFEIGYNVKEDHRAHNLHPACWVDVFKEFNNCNVDLKNKKVILS